MGYRVLGRTHAELVRAARRAAGAARRAAGQGTVEYVALVLLVAVVLAGVVAATRKTSLGGAEIGEAIVKQLKKAIDQVK
jgi:hypothetical protein